MNHEPKRMKSSPLFVGSVWSAEPQLTRGSLSWKVSIVKLEPVRMRNWWNIEVKFLQTLQSRDNIIGGTGTGIRRQRESGGGTGLTWNFIQSLVLVVGQTFRIVMLGTTSYLPWPNRRLPGLNGGPMRHATCNMWDVKGDMSHGTVITATVTMFLECVGVMKPRPGRLMLRLECSRAAQWSRLKYHKGEY